jgi:hypothetical protein
MPTTVQLLDDFQALKRISSYGSEIPISASYQHGWDVTGGEVELTGSEVAVDTRYSLKIYPLNAGPVTITLTDIPLKESDIDRLISFNAKASCNSAFSASVTISIFDGSSYPSGNGVFTNVQSGTFTALRSNYVTVGAIPAGQDFNKLKISITFTGHSDTNILFTLPHLIHDFGFYSNGFVASSRSFLPDFYWEKDGDAESPDYPFFRLIDILTSAASDARIESIRMYGVELDEFLTEDEQVEPDSNSSLTSASGVRDDYTQWISQFSGEKLYKNFQDKNGNLYFDNPSLSRDFTEWQISKGYYGRAAGTRRAIIEAAQQVLVKTKDGEVSSRSVAVTPLYLGEPFSILVQTLENETIDANIGEESSLVSQSIALAKPLGYMLVHSTVQEYFFTFDSPSLGVLDEFRWG